MFQKGGLTMKLFEDVVITKTGQRGTIVDEGMADGKHYFIVELDDIQKLENTWDGLPCCWDDELQPV